jgi:hypothetical protein
LTFACAWQRRRRRCSVLGAHDVCACVGRAPNKHASGHHNCSATPALPAITQGRCTRSQPHTPRATHLRRERRAAEKQPAPRPALCSRVYAAVLQVHARQLLLDAAERGLGGARVRGQQLRVCVCVVRVARSRGCGCGRNRHGGLSATCRLIVSTLPAPHTPCCTQHKHPHRAAHAVLHTPWTARTVLHTPCRTLYTSSVTSRGLRYAMLLNSSSTPALLSAAARSCASALLLAPPLCGARACSAARRRQGAGAAGGGRRGGWRVPVRRATLTTPQTTAAHSYCAFAARTCAA